MQLMEQHRAQVGLGRDGYAVAQLGVHAPVEPVRYHGGSRREGHLAHPVIRIHSQHEPIGNGGEEPSDFGDGAFSYALDRAAFRPGERMLDFPVLDVHKAVVRTRRAEDPAGDERQPGDRECSSCSRETPGIDGVNHSVK